MCFTELFVIITLAVSVSGDCPPGSYLGPVTNHCDDCGDICEHADIQGTQADCQRLCAGYRQDGAATTQLPQCPSDQYYDSAISRCDYCSVICDNHVIQGTTAQCKDKCPTYFEPKVIESQQLTPAVITICCILGLCIVLVSVYGLMVCFCEHRLPSRLQRRLPCVIGGYKKPVECTESHTDSPGSSSLTSLSGYEVPNPGTVTIQMPNPEFGLTELQCQRQSSGDGSNA
ncbi:uncharacterized protein LOC124254511 [Haliotis rubra]|uniref:uncharacterized protein LOC124254511 n=1 Tax=Haliotis rubra TaxID=36100 RepID=UPI001EE6359A|nr:uncharacterized protein LOC124254511 [Haliotis rubra]